MRVALLHPVWDRSCTFCETYVTEPDGRVFRDRTTGEPVLRSLYGNVPTPCHICEKVPREVRDTGVSHVELRKHAVELTDRNRRAWHFYRQCRAVGHFPDDPIVRWYAAILRDLYDYADRRPLEELITTIRLLRR